MVFGYSTNAFVKFSLDEAIEKIAALGFKGIEIMGDRPHLYPPDFEPDDLDRIRGAVEKWGLKVTNLNSFTLFAVGDTYLPSWIEPEPERRQIRVRHTLECLRVAKNLNCRNISIPPGGPPIPGMSREKAIGLFHRELEKVLPLAESLEVKVLVEPEPGLLIENSRQILDFVREIQSPAVGINFDMGHFFCVGDDPVASLELLLPWVGHMHLEDIAPTRVHQHLIPGLGVLPFDRILETVQTLGYEGDISLELYPYVDMPETAGRESREYLRPFFGKAGILL